MFESSYLYLFFFGGGGLGEEGGGFFSSKTFIFGPRLWDWPITVEENENNCHSKFISCPFSII